MSTSSIDSLEVYSLQNDNGLMMSVTNYGGKIMTLLVPDKNGALADIVLGYDTVNQYLKGNRYFGALIGRYGNRVAKGKFIMDGKEYQLAVNNGLNSLHGGPGGFHCRYWKARSFRKEGADALELRYKSIDGEEGYPGNLDVKVIYSLTNQNELVIEYEATTNKPTVINLTHHSFFNLAGEGNGDILNHMITINADRFLPVDEGLIPTGEFKQVKGTPFDFTSPRKIGERIGYDDQQLKFGRGYDHSWILNKKSNELSMAARASESSSGRVMEVWTTEPGLQFYTGNFLDGSDVGKGGKPYNYRTAFCFEAQHFPDSPNHIDFPTTVLKPGEIYRQKTVYRFSTEK
jgi:aldose 1-epimerase